MENKDVILFKKPMSDNDIHEYFKNEITAIRKYLKDEKKQSKLLYLNLKKKVNSENNNKMNLYKLKKHMEYADFLRHFSHYNFVALYNYAHFALEHQSMECFNIYHNIKNYCQIYDRLSKLMAYQVLYFDENKKINAFNKYIKKSIVGLKEKNKDLIDNVFQVIKKDRKVKSKRIFNEVTY